MLTLASLLNILEQLSLDLHVFLRTLRVNGCSLVTIGLIKEPI